MRRVPASVSFAEPVHLPGPLKRDHRPLQSGQKVKRETYTSNSECGEQHQRLRVEPEEDEMQHRRHQVTHNEDCQVSRAVIRAVMREILAAHRAIVTYSQVALEQRSGPAIGTLATKSFAQGRPKLAFLGSACIDLGCVVRHNVPFAC